MTRRLFLTTECGGHENAAIGVSALLIRLGVTASSARLRKQSGPWTIRPAPVPVVCNGANKSAAAQLKCIALAIRMTMCLFTPPLAT
jgi:hypothetical protein